MTQESLGEQLKAPLKCPAASCSQIIQSIGPKAAVRDTTSHKQCILLMWVGRVVKSTDPAISPFHEMAEKMSGKRSIYLLLPIQGRNRTRTTKGGGKAWRAHKTNKWRNSSHR